MCRSGSRESYLLTDIIDFYMVPRSRLRAPLRGSTQRRRRFLRDDKEGCLLCELYNFSQLK